MAALDPEGIIPFTACGAEYRAKFGFRAQKEVERHFDKPFMTALQSVMPQLAQEDMGDEAKVHAASADISLTHLGEMFRFSLLAYQPDIDAEEVEGIIDDIGLPKALSIMFDALRSARSFNPEAGKDATENPPRRQRRAARKTGAS
jgi:hypothetical protein